MKAVSTILQGTIFMLLAVTGFSLAQTGSNVTLLLNVNDHAASGYNECWGYTDATGREYALLGVETGTSIIDITDTENPVEINFVPTPSSTWKDIKTYQDYAYVVIDAFGQGLQIIDLSDLPNSAPLVNTYTGNGFTSSHNIFIDETTGVLYATDGGSVRALDLSGDPANPVELGFIPSMGSHDVFVKNDVLYVSEGWNASFSMFNVANAGAPILLGRFQSFTGGYAHNAWIHDDGAHLFTTEEVPANLSMKVWDVSDPTDISFVDEYLASSGGRPHNVHIKGDYAYLSHYWDGMRILDVSDPASVTEVAYFDSYPDPGFNFEGNWGAYPFFRSGKVLMSDRSTGLYVLYFEGADETTGLGSGDLLPESFALEQNYPNPFNPATTINYRLNTPAQVTLEVFNINGQRIRQLVNESQTAGSYQVIWDARNDAGGAVASGTYLYKLSTGSTQETRQMVYLR